MTAAERSTCGPTEFLRWLVLVNGIGDLLIAVPLLFFARPFASILGFVEPSAGMGAAMGGWGHACVILGLWRIWAHYNPAYTLFTAACAAVEGWMIAVYALLCMAIYGLSFLQVSAAALYALAFAMVYPVAWIHWWRRQGGQRLGFLRREPPARGAGPARLLLVNGLCAVVLATSMVLLPRRLGLLLGFPDPSDGMCYVVGGWGLSALVLGAWRIVAFSRQQYARFTAILALVDVWLLAIYALICVAAYALTPLQVSAVFVYALLFGILFAVAWIFGRGRDVSAERRKKRRT